VVKCVRPCLSPVDVRKRLFLKAVLAGMGGHLHPVVDKRTTNSAKSYHDQNDRNASKVYFSIFILLTKDAKTSIL